MNVQIQSVKFDADKRLIEFVEHKMEKKSHLQLLLEVEKSKN